MPKLRILIGATVAGLAAFASAASAQTGLMAVYQEARDADPILRQARANLNATEMEKPIAWSNWLPQLSASAGINWTETKASGPNGSFETDAREDSWRVRLDQSIYDQANFDRLQQADAQIRRGGFDYVSAEQSFYLRVVQGYFGVLRARDQLRFAEAEQKAISRQLEQARQRYEVGLTAVTDVHEAKASADAARARTIVARNTLDDAYEGLRELTGRYYDRLRPLQEEIPLTTPEPATLDEWVQLAMDNNPAVLSARANVDVLEEGVDLARDGHLPTLDLGVTRSNSTTDDVNLASNFPVEENDNTTIGLTLTVPIYSGGRTSSVTRQTSYQAEAAREQLEQTMRNVQRNVRNAYRSVIAGISEVQAREQTVVSAQSALDATEAGFEVGTRTIVDILLSQQNLFSARRQYANARYDYLLAKLELEQAVGELDVKDLEQIQALLGSMNENQSDAS